MTQKQAILIYDKLVLLHCCLSYLLQNKVNKMYREEVHTLLMTLTEDPSVVKLITPSRMRYFNGVWDLCKVYCSVAHNDTKGWSQSRASFISLLRIP